MDDFVLLAPVMKFMIRLIPFRSHMDDVHRAVYFHAEHESKIQTRSYLPIILAGLHQAFQFLYINSQLWVSKCTMLSTVALPPSPLFLLWLQISWTICLFGAELTYAGQNIRSFSFDQDTRNISRRYRTLSLSWIMFAYRQTFRKE